MSQCQSPHLDLTPPRSRREPQLTPADLVGRRVKVKLNEVEWRTGKFDKSDARRVSSPFAAARRASMGCAGSQLSVYCRLSRDTSHPPEASFATPSQPPTISPRAEEVPASPPLRRRRGQRRVGPRARRHDPDGEAGEAQVRVLHRSSASEAQACAGSRGGSGQVAPCSRPRSSGGRGRTRRS